MKAKEILEQSLAYQQMCPSMLDYMGKRDGIDFIQIRDHVVFRPSVLTGHAGYRVYRGPEQRPWWWKTPDKPVIGRLCGSRDPALLIR